MAVNNNEEMMKLHWDPKVPRLGLGNLLKKVNHVAIIVSDVNRSLSFYTQILGLQQIRRPNFDRHGAWLTMGNCELHLIKGNPVVTGGDHLIVPHISFESDHIEQVLAELKKMKVPFSRNVSVPDAKGLHPVTQYFIRDPDGHYIELCDCDILTSFCLGTDQRGIEYNEVVDHVDISHLFKFAILAQKAIDSNEKIIVPEESAWAKEADRIKLENMLARTKVFGDLMQGETRESISLALRKANNFVPLATKIIRADKRGKEKFLPPAYYENGVNKHQPEFYEAPKTTEIKENEERVSSYEQIAVQMFRHFDKDLSGTLTKNEIRDLLAAIHQTPSQDVLDQMFSQVDKDGDGSIDLQEFLSLVTAKPADSEQQWKAFFNLLDMDGNDRISSPELAMIIRSLNLPLHDSHVENLFIEADLDGNGVLSLEEVKKFIFGF